LHGQPRRLFAQCLDELQYRPLLPTIGDASVSLHQSDSIRVVDTATSHSGDISAGHLHFLEEEGHGHVERTGQGPQPAGAYAIVTAFVSVDLLEGQVDRLTERTLADTQHPSAPPYLRSHAHIDWMSSHSPSGLHGSESGESSARHEPTSALRV
jgi:hypothetical protein